MGVASVEGRCATESIVSKYEQSSEVTNTMEIDIINYLVNKTKTRKTIAKHAKFRKIFNSCENSSSLRYVRCKDECRVKFPCSLKWQARSVFVSSHGHDRRFPCTFAVSHGFFSDDSFGNSVSLLRQIVWKFLRKLQRRVQQLFFRFFSTSVYLVSSEFEAILFCYTIACLSFQIKKQ